jgi:methylmalonyl-CoA carboxyltransferase 12S subunit
MKKPTINDVAVLLAEIREQLAALTERVAQLEKVPEAPAAGKQEAAAAVPAAAVAPVASAAPAPVAAVEEITEEEMLAISAALAAYLGVKARIRQIRLLSGSAWAQQGRVSIQASHRL